MKQLNRDTALLPLSAALKVDLAAKELAAQGFDIVNFCVGEPDGPTPGDIVQKGIEGLISGHTKYTNACGTPELREAVSRHYSKKYSLTYSEDEITVTTGGKFAVFAALKTIAEPGDEVILPAPYWTSYYHSIVLAGGRPVTIPCSHENRFKLTPAELESAVSDRTKAVILNNPNNPTGAVYSRDELEALYLVIKKYDLYVISDEIYDCYNYTEKPFTSFPSLCGDARERTFLINGVSKAYAMTGWRIGYALMPQYLTKPFRSILSHTTGCPNADAQFAAAYALTEHDAAGLAETFKRRRDLICSILKDTPGICFNVPDGAFYLMLEHNTENLPELLLRNAHVAVVPCDDYGISNAIRLSYTLSEDRLTEGAIRIKKYMTDRKA